MMLKGRHIILTGCGTRVVVHIARTLGDTSATVSIVGRTEASFKEQGLSFEVCDVTDKEPLVRTFVAARSVSRHTLSLSGGKI